MKTFKDFLAESTRDLHNLVGKDSPIVNRLNTFAKNMSPSSKRWHEKAFPGNENHIEMDLPHEAPESVKDHVEKNGGKISDDGHSVTLRSGREVPTSKFLGKSNAPRHILADYQHHSRNSTEPGSTKLVISRHPGEVASASTGTHWDSCSNLAPADGQTGPAADAMHHELKHGTMIAMHVNKDAPKNNDGEYDAKHVLGRVLLKKYHTDDGQVNFHPEEKTYGKFPKAALDKVHEFVGKHNTHTHAAEFKNENVYDDDGKTVKFNKNSKPKDVIKAYESAEPEDKHHYITKHDTPVELLHHVFKNGANPHAKASIAKAHNLPEDLADKMLKSKDSIVVGASLGHKVHSSDKLHSIMEKDPSIGARHADKLANNKNLLGKTINHIISNHPSSAEYFMKHPNISQKHLTDALTTEKHGEHAAIRAAQNTNISDENLHHALDHEDPEVVHGAINNQSMKDSHFDKLLAHKNLGYVNGLSAVHNPSISKEKLLKFARHEDDDIASEAKHVYRKRFK